MVFGVGTTDIPTSDLNGKRLKSYSVWCDMLRRCYDSKCRNYKWYGAKGIIVCDDWLLFSNFKKWYDENYIDGYVLDKDVKCRDLDSKIYSPENCSFISDTDNKLEAVSRRDFSDISGSNNVCYGRTGEKHPMFGKRGLKSPNSKSLKYWEENSINRQNFKRICKNNNFKFDDFIEVFSHYMMRKSGDRLSMYNYFHKEEKC
ncbi:MAG: hypothetical protein ACRCXT_14290 [Paraclostridium sp.]